MYNLVKKKTIYELNTIFFVKSLGKVLCENIYHNN